MTFLLLQMWLSPQLTIDQGLAKAQFGITRQGLLLSPEEQMILLGYHETPLEFQLSYDGALQPSMRFQTSLVGPGLAVPYQIDVLVEESMISIDRQIFTEVGPGGGGRIAVYTHDVRSFQGDVSASERAEFAGNLWLEVGDSVRIGSGMESGQVRMTSVPIAPAWQTRVGSERLLANAKGTVISWPLDLSTESLPAIKGLWLQFGGLTLRVLDVVRQDGSRALISLDGVLRLENEAECRAVILATNVENSGVQGSIPILKEKQDD